MPKSKNTEQRVWEFAQKPVEELGYILWDVLYEKHGGYSELTLFIDRTDGEAVSTDDCEKVSRVIDPLMDRYDPIEESYTFSVSSCGFERVLRYPVQMEAFLGQEVHAGLYRADPETGAKTLSGILTAYTETESGTVRTITLNLQGQDRTLAMKEVAQVKTAEESK